MYSIFPNIWSGGCCKDDVSSRFWMLMLILLQSWQHWFHLDMSLFEADIWKFIGSWCHSLLLRCSTPILEGCCPAGLGCFSASATWFRWMDHHQLVIQVWTGLFTTHSYESGAESGNHQRPAGQQDWSWTPLIYSLFLSLLVVVRMEQPSGHCRKTHRRSWDFLMYLTLLVVYVNSCVLLRFTENIWTPLW